MIKPTALITWPLHLDFPVCRWNLERFKDKFDGIYIALSDHHVENQDLSNFFRSKMPFANFIEPKRTRDDWRDDAVNNLLDVVKSEYVLFLEQDFLMADGFLDKVLAEPHDFAFYQEDKRIHPAFALVKRSLIDKTSRDFSAQPPGDHFYKFFNELPTGVNIEELGAMKKIDYYHMAGLSQNYRNFTYGDPFYHPINFLYYNYMNLKFPDQHPLFYQLELQIEKTYGHAPIHTFLNNFFPKEIK